MTVGVRESECDGEWVGDMLSVIEGESVSDVLSVKECVSDSDGDSVNVLVMLALLVSEGLSDTSLVSLTDEVSEWDSETLREDE